MYSVVRSAAAPPRMRRWPRNFPLSWLNGARPAKGGDLLPVQPSQLGQLGHQRGAGRRADAGDALDQSRLARQSSSASISLRRWLVEVGDLLVEEPGSSCRCCCWRCDGRPAAGGSVPCSAGRPAAVDGSPGRRAAADFRAFSASAAAGRGGRTSASVSASMRSVLASRPRALAKSRTCTRIDDGDGPAGVDQLRDQAVARSRRSLRARPATPSGEPSLSSSRSTAPSSTRMVNERPSGRRCTSQEDLRNVDADEDLAEFQWRNRPWKGPCLADASWSPARGDRSGVCSG